MRTQKSNSMVDDIKEVMSLLPMLKGALGEPSTSASTAQPDLPGLMDPFIKPKTPM